MQATLLTTATTPLSRRIAALLVAHTAAPVYALTAATPVPPAAAALPPGVQPVTPPARPRDMVALLQQYAIDTVLHLDIVGLEQPTTHGEPTLHHNVLATAVLLGACRAAGVRRVLLASSTLVCGADVCTPLFVNEDTPPATWRGSRPHLLRELADIERNAATFAARAATPAVLVVRMAMLLGDGAQSPLAVYVQQPNPPVLLGFDPRVQGVHPADAARGWLLAATHPTLHGTLHLAALPPVPLYQAIRLAGNQPRRVALSRWLPPLPGGLPRALLRYSCVASTARATTELGWQPAYTPLVLLYDLADPPSAAPTVTPIPTTSPQNEETVP